MHGTTHQKATGKPGKTEEPCKVTVKTEQKLILYTR